MWCATWMDLLMFLVLMKNGDVDGRCKRGLTTFMLEWLLPPANEVWGKLIFWQACVIPSVLSSVHGQEGGAVVGFPAGITGHMTGGRGGLPPGDGVYIQRGGGWADPPLSEHWRIRSTNGRYASYWNAFLFMNNLCDINVVRITNNNSSHDIDAINTFSSYDIYVGVSQMLQEFVRHLYPKHFQFFSVITI